MRFSVILVFLIPLNVLCQETTTEEVEISQDLSNALSRMFNNSGSEEELDSEEEFNNFAMIHQPTLHRRPTGEGLVRVQVHVDKSGKVTEAKFDPENSTFSPQNSTTDNDQLVQLAEEAALTATFESHPLKQTRIGWVQFNFVLE